MGSVGKNVLIIVQNLPVPFDRRVWLEARTLTEAGYTVSIICPTGQHGKYTAPYEFIEGIHVHRYPAPLEAHGVIGYVFEFAYCWLMTALLSLGIWLDRGFDIIHACNPPETFFLLAYFYKLFGVKFLFDHHDLSPEMYLAKGGEKTALLHRGLLWLERMTFRAADIVITTNESHKRIAVERGEVSPEDVYVVRSGPDLQRLQVLPVESKLKEGFDYLVCYLGEMCEQDGVDKLLYAAQFIVHTLKRRDVKFALLGGGPELPKLRQLKGKLHLDDRVEFLGRVSDRDLCRYLSSADLCVDPDPYTEWSDKSTMNKIMEYMFFGKPIVAFDLVENRNSAQDAAVYASRQNDYRELASLIVALLDNPERQQQMGTFGKNRVAKSLMWEHSKAPLLAAYNRLIGIQRESKSSTTASETAKS